MGTYAKSHPPGPIRASPHPGACMASAVLISIHRKEGNKEGRDRNDPGWCMWAAGRPCKTVTDLPDLLTRPTAAHTGGSWVTSAQLLSVGRFEWGAGPLALGRTRPSEEGRKSRVSLWAPGKRGTTKVRRTQEAWDKQQLCQRRAPGASQRPVCLLQGSNQVKDMKGCERCLRKCYLQMSPMGVSSFYQPPGAWWDRRGSNTYTAPPPPNTQTGFPMPRW